MVVSKRNLLFQVSIFSCYVSFREGTNYLNLPWFGLSQEVLHRSRCEQKSSALLCLNLFASSLPTVRLAFLCDLVCFFKNPKFVVKFRQKRPKERRTRMWVVRMAWILFGHCRFDEGHGNGNFYDFDTPHTMRHQLRRNFPQKGDASDRAELGGNSWALVSQKVTQRGWGIRGCRG